MSDTITIDEVQKIARLARLEITSDQANQYQGQLSQIISYFQVLDQLDLSQTPITSQVTGLENITRKIDEVGTRTLSAQSAVSQAPSQHNNYIKVPAILANREESED